MIKSTKQIKEDLEKHCDHAVAYSDALEALEYFEKHSFILEYYVIELFKAFDKKDSQTMYKILEELRFYALYQSSETLQ